MKSESRSILPLRAAGVVIGLLGIFPMAAVIKWAPVVQWLPQAGAEWLLSSAIVIGLAWVLARSSAANDLLSAARDRLLTIERREWMAWMVLLTFTLSLAASWYCFDFQPVMGDELSQRFQARLIADGRLWGLTEPHYEFFSGIQTLNIEGRWFSQFPIGGPAMLAIGMLFGAPWIMNPIAAAWTTVNVYRFAARATDELTGRIAALLFATSPFVLLMSASQMNHVGALAFIMMALAALAEWVDAPNPDAARWAAFRVGFGVAASATFRPWDALGFAIVIALFQLAAVRRDRTRWKSIVTQVVGGVIPVAVLLLVNWRTTGNPLLFGYDALNGASHRPGFHVDPSGNDFTPLQGIHHISSYLLLLNASLFAGPIPAVLLMVTTLVLLRRASGWDYLMVGLIGALLAGYATYWAESFFVGPRFLYAGVPVFVILVARLPQAGRARGEAAGRFARMLLPVMVAFAWILPPRVTRFQGVMSAAVNTRETRPHVSLYLANELSEAQLENAIVFVHESWHGRLTARLRALGAPALTAESMVTELDACALHVGLDAEERIPGPPSKLRIERVVRRALMSGTVKQVPTADGNSTIGLVNGKLYHPLCEEEYEADRQGSVPLDRFLSYERFDAQGHLGGNIVFARDFGLRNQQLLGRFGDRTWYRYRPRTGPNDHEPVFVPYFEVH